MKVLFILREVNFFERFGIMYLSSLLKGHGHIVNFCCSLEENPDDVMQSMMPDIVAYSFTTGFHNYYVALNRKLKDEYQFFSIAGGPHPTFYPDVLQEGFDAICIGEGEFALLDIVNALSNGEDISSIQNLHVRIEDQTYKNPLRPLISNLDDLPFPDRESIYAKSKTLQESRIKCFMAGRGCPYKCSYCFNREFNKLTKGLGKIVRKRSPGNIIAEIKEVLNRYPLEIVRFMDDTFIINPGNWLEKFADLYKKEINLPYVCMGRYELINKDTAALLKDSGCISIYNAIEAGNDRIRNTIAERRQTKVQILEGSKFLHDANINICAENVIAFPTESLEEMFETVQLNIDAGVSCAIASILNPYPGTKVAEIALENNLWDGNLNSAFSSFFEGTPLNYSQKERKFIIRIRHLFNIWVAFPFLFKFRKILIKLPFTWFYKYCSELLHMYLLHKRIFPYKLSLREIFLHGILFLKRNRQ